MQCSLLSGQLLVKHCFFSVLLLLLSIMHVVYLVLLSLQFNPLRPITEDDPKYKKNPTLKDRIHCLVAVLPADTVSVMDNEKIRQMRVVREKARILGESYNIYMFILKNTNFMHMFHS